MSVNWSLGPVWSDQSLWCTITRVTAIVFLKFTTCSRAHIPFVSYSRHMSNCACYQLQEARVGKEYNACGLKLNCQINLHDTGNIFKEIEMLIHGVENEYITDNNDKAHATTLIFRYFCQDNYAFHYIEKTNLNSRSQCYFDFNCKLNCILNIARYRCFANLCFIQPFYYATLIISYYLMLFYCHLFDFFAVVNYVTVLFNPSNNDLIWATSILVWSSITRHGFIEAKRSMKAKFTFIIQFRMYYEYTKYVCRYV